MDIWETEKLVLFIAFVIPGFISIKFYQLIFPGTSRATPDQVIDAIAYSSINYALLFWPILSVEDGGLKSAHPNLYYIFYIFVLFGAPVIWVLIWSWLRKHPAFQGTAPHPTEKPWDFVFQQRKSYWVIVYLKSGEQVGGKFSSKSFASSSPAEEQIYLEETWIVNENGGLEREVKQTAGTIIMASEISRVELIKYE